MDGPPFCLAFVMVKESVVVPAILFYLESAANKKDKGGTTLSTVTLDKFVNSP